jgi:hydrogenase nickel incorporation protein HypA/HybF
MHELGIVYEVIKVVDQIAKENQVTKVEKIVLEIGQLSQAIPRFIQECFPAAVDQTPYEDTELEIITLEAIGECHTCQTTYNIILHRKICPSCQNDSFKLISGQEFNIKEIVAY